MMIRYFCSTTKAFENLFTYYHPQIDEVFPPTVFPLFPFTFCLTFSLSCKAWGFCKASVALEVSIEDAPFSWACDVLKPSRAKEIRPRLDSPLEADPFRSTILEVLCYHLFFGEPQIPEILYRDWSPGTMHSEPTRQSWVLGASSRPGVGMSRLSIDFGVTSRYADYFFCVSSSGFQGDEKGYPIRLTYDIVMLKL